MIIGFKRLSDNAILPTKANASDSGWDLYAAEDAIIAPGETAVIKTDIAVQLPEGFGATVRPRSGITSKTKLRVQLGTIDNSYTGNIGIIVDNINSLLYENTVYSPIVSAVESSVYELITGTYERERYEIVYNGTYKIKKGDKLAQLVLERIYDAEAIEIFELEETERGSNGFGSSGYGVNK